MASAGAAGRRMAPQHGPGGEGDVSALPYRSDLMASLGALLNLWDSPVFHLEVPTAGGEPLDEAAHRMVRHLSFRGPMRPSALAEELGTGRSNISKIIRRLEGEGLVAREGDDRDTRGTWVRLTPAGLDVAQRFYDLGDRLAAQVLEQWDPADVATYTRLMARFTRSAVEQAHVVRRHGLGAVPALQEREEQASPHGPRVEP